MRTKKEIESAISEEINRFERDYMGRGPKCIQVHLLDDLLVIRLRGVLAPAEENLVKSLPGKRAGFAQASAVTPDRNDPPSHGADGRECHRRRGCDHAP